MQLRKFEMTATERAKLHQQNVVQAKNNWSNVWRIEIPLLKWRGIFFYLEYFKSNGRSRQ
jgi:hypothetical protein